MNKIVILHCSKKLFPFFYIIVVTWTQKVSRLSRKLQHKTSVGEQWLQENTKMTGWLLFWKQPNVVIFMSVALYKIHLCWIKLATTNWDPCVFTKSANSISVILVHKGIIWFVEKNPITCQRLLHHFHLDIFRKP